MTEKPIGERMAHIEGMLDEALPIWRRVDDKVDKALTSLEGKAEKDEVVDLKMALAKKADREEVLQLKLTLAKWSAIGGAFIFVVSVFGKNILEWLSK